jgi:hypothetical protein
MRAGRHLVSAAAYEWLAAGGDVLGFALMELNQIRRFVKDLEERTDSLRRYL